jgi:hypothetical protein
VCNTCAVYVYFSVQTFLGFTERHEGKHSQTSNQGMRVGQSKIEGLINFSQKKIPSLVCDGFFLKFEKLIAVLFLF